MNAADIKAARRLIAQFEDRAIGRHNSSIEMRGNPVQGRDSEEAFVVNRHEITVGHEDSCYGIEPPAFSEGDFYTHMLPPAKERPEDCAVGEWVYYIPGIPPTHKWPVRLRFADDRRNVLINSDHLSEFKDMMFEPFRFCRAVQKPGTLAIPQLQTGWRRVS